MIESIKKQIGKLIFLEPFFASIALGLKITIDKDPQATAWVCGDQMGFGTDFWESLNPKQQRTLICHEVMHKALLHDIRIPHRAKDNFTLWNKACDYAINQHLLDKTRFEFPPNGQTDPIELRRFNNQSAEQIFATLMDEAEEENNDGNDQGQDQNEQEKSDEENESGGGSNSEGNSDDQENDEEGQSGDGQGDNTDGDGNASDDQPSEWGEVRECQTDGDPEEEIQKRKREVRQAMMQSQNAGQIPLGLEQAITDTTLKPNVPWETLVESWVGNRAPVDYSFVQPKQINNVLLPRFSADALGRIVIVLDSSGSMTKPHMDKAITEVRSASATFEEAGMDQTFGLIYADTEVHSADELEPNDPIPSPKGGGGTCFDSAFDFIDKMDDEPIGVIVITDGFVSVEKSCQAEVLYMITPHGSPRFGTDMKGIKSEDNIIRMSN